MTYSHVTCNLDSATAGGKKYSYIQEIPLPRLEMSVAEIAAFAEEYLPLEAYEYALSELLSLLYHAEAVVRSGAVRGLARLAVFEPCGSEAIAAAIKERAPAEPSFMVRSDIRVALDILKA